MPNVDYMLPNPPPIDPSTGQSLPHNQADNDRILAYVDGLMQEAYDERRRWDDQADLNALLYLGKAALVKPRNGMTAHEVNRIRNVCIAHVQVQTEETPRVKLGARETAEPGLPFLNLQQQVNFSGPAGGPLKTLFGSIRPECYAPTLGPDGQPADPLPLNDQEQQLVQAAIDMKLLPVDALILVNDRTAADAEQTIFDIMWDECRADFYNREATFLKTDIGWQFQLYGFDDDRKQHTLWNPSHLLVFIDPLCTDIRDAAHAETVEFVDLRRAQARYPAYAQQLQSFSQVGPGVHGTVGDFPFRMPRVMERTDFRRRMVPVRHCWIRDWPFPVAPDQAIASGQVYQDQEEAEPARDAVVDDQGNEVLPATPAVMRPVMKLPGGMNIDPTMPGWPTRRGIREICIVGNVVVSDKETEFGDIPLPHFVNLPVPQSPYGQGEPEALQPLQYALDCLLTDVINYFHYFGAPVTVMPLSVAQRLQGFAEGVYQAAYGETWEVPDDLMKQYGAQNLVGFLDPPPLPADFWRFFQMLLDLIDKQGQVTEALEGEGESHWSGDLAARLQEAARGLIAWKSQRMEEGILYQANLMLYSIRTRLTLDDLTRMCSKYPRHVWAAIRERRKDVYKDITVEIVSGSGQLREKAKADAITLWAGGKGALSNTTLLERFGEDPKLELQNKVTEAQDYAKAAAQIQQVAPAPQPLPGAGMPPPGGPAGVPGAPPPVAPAPPAGAVPAAATAA